MSKNIEQVKNTDTNSEELREPVEILAKDETRGSIPASLSTKVTEEEIDAGVDDGNGGIYSPDGLRLLEYNGDAQTYTIKEGTKVICNRAFSKKHLEYVIIPDSVIEIGDGAFFGCNWLESVAIPDSVTKIGYFAFSCCRGLQSVIIPNSVTKIGDYPFSGCKSLHSIIVPAGTMGKFKQLLLFELHLLLKEAVK